jgi:hypothetical protein
MLFSGIYDGTVLNSRRFPIELVSIYELLFQEYFSAVLNVPLASVDLNVAVLDARI